MGAQMRASPDREQRAGNWLALGRTENSRALCGGRREGNSRAPYASGRGERNEPRITDRESQVITELLFGSYNNQHLCVAF